MEGMCRHEGLQKRARSRRRQLRHAEGLTENQKVQHVICEDEQSEEKRDMMSAARRSMKTRKLEVPP